MKNVRETRWTPCRVCGGRRSARVYLFAAAALLLLAGVSASSAADAPEASVYTRKWTRPELEETLKISKEWLGNSLGKDEIAPPPWTPMQASGQSIRCWGKEFRYNNSVFPVSITSLGAELLSGKPAVRVKSGGQWIVFADAEVTIERKHDGLVNARSVSRSGAYTLEVTAGYEFDGMGKVALRLSAAEPVMADSLHLEFPLSEKHTVLYHWAGSRSRGLTIGGKPVPGAALPPMSTCNIGLGGCMAARTRRSSPGSPT